MADNACLMSLEEAGKKTEYMLQKFITAVAAIQETNDKLQTMITAMAKSSADHPRDSSANELYDRTLFIKIYNEEYRISCEVLNQVFSGIGNVESIEKFDHGNQFHSRICFQDRESAVRALEAMNQRYIYAGCCRMELFLEAETVDRASEMEFLTQEPNRNLKEFQGQVEHFENFGVEEVPNQQFPESIVGEVNDRTLLIKIHLQLYSISWEELEKVFSRFGAIEYTEILCPGGDFHSKIRFQNKESAITAFDSMNHREIYDGCCRMELSFDCQISSRSSEIEAEHIGDAFPSCWEETEVESLIEVSCQEIKFDVLSESFRASQPVIVDESKKSSKTQFELSEVNSEPKNVATSMTSPEVDIAYQLFEEIPGIILSVVDLGLIPMDKCSQAYTLVFDPGGILRTSIRDYKGSLSCRNGMASLTELRKVNFPQITEIRALDVNCWTVTFKIGSGLILIFDPGGVFTLIIDGILCSTVKIVCCCLEERLCHKLISRLDLVSLSKASEHGVLVVEGVGMISVWFYHCLAWVFTREEASVMAEVVKRRQWDPGRSWRLEKFLVSLPNWHQVINASIGIHKNCRIVFVTTLFDPGGTLDFTGVNYRCWVTSSGSKAGGYLLHQLGAATMLFSACYCLDRGRRRCYSTTSICC